MLLNCRQKPILCREENKMQATPLNLLCIGDVVGPAAVDYLGKNLWALRQEYAADFVVVNAENAAAGNGTDPETARALFASGADVLTGGNHSFQKRSFYEYLEGEPRALRPANYTAACPGSGYGIFDCRGYRLLCINVSGTAFMQPLACPFETVEKILARESGGYDFALLDIHAEATSEKIALAHAFDGKISVIYGTHTHVQTADERILSRGTGYLTDLGMTGCEQESVLGVRADCIIDFLRTKMPCRFLPAEGPVSLHGALFSIDPETAKVTSVRRIAKTE